MGKLFLASRSSLGVVVLVLPEDGSRYPLPPQCFWGDGGAIHYVWGEMCEGCNALAYALLCQVVPEDQRVLGGRENALSRRLAACNHDVWIMTEAEVLDGLHLTS